MKTFETLTGICANSFAAFTATRTQKEIKEAVESAVGYEIADGTAQYLYHADGSHMRDDDGDKVALPWTIYNALAGLMFENAGLGRNPSGSVVLAYEKANQIEFPRLKGMSTFTFNRTEVIAFMRGISLNATGQVFSGVAGATIAADYGNAGASVKRLTALKLSEDANKLTIKQSQVLPLNNLYVNAYATPVAGGGKKDSGACLNIGQAVAVEYYDDITTIARMFKPNTEIVGMLTFPIADLPKMAANLDGRFTANFRPVHWLAKHINLPTAHSTLSEWHQELLSLEKKQELGIQTGSTNECWFEMARQVYVTPNDNMRNQKEDGATPLPAMLEAARKLGLLATPAA